MCTAWTGERAYKQTMSHEEVKGALITGQSKQFDPQTANTFVAVEVEFLMVTKSDPAPTNHKVSLESS